MNNYALPVGVGWLIAAAVWAVRTALWIDRTLRERRGASGEITETTDAINLV